MRVGIVTTWGNCGAGYVSLAYAQALRKQGCDVWIYARGTYLRQPEFAQDQGFPITWDPCLDGLTRVDHATFRRWLDAWTPDWLLFNEQRCWQPLLQARRQGIRCAAYIDYYRSDTISLFRLYDLLLCNTRRHAQVFWEDDRMRYLPWGTDLNRFQPLSQRSDASVRFLHSAGMSGPNDRKGTDLALRAFCGITGKATFILHTQLPPERWPAEWQACIATDPRIQVKTERLPPEQFYQQGDVYVYPSRLEGIGLTLPEAVASGLACIATDEAPMREFLREGKTGFGVPVAEYRGRFDGYFWPEAWCDESALQDRMQRYVDQPHLAQLHGQAARELALQQLDWQKNAAPLCSWLEETPARTLSASELAVLSTQARALDRVLEPTPLDHFWAGAKALARRWRRYWQGIQAH